MKPKLNQAEKKVQGIENKLNIEEKRKEIELEDIPEFKSSGDYEKDLKEDYQFVRNKLMRLLERTETAVEEGTRSLKTLPNSTMIESVSSLLKNAGEVSKQLLELHKNVAWIEDKRFKETKPVESEENKSNNKGTLRDVVRLVNDKEGTG